MVKQITYGLCYGMGSGKMATRLGVPELQAREMADDFKGSHPALTAWMQVGVPLCAPELVGCVVLGYWQLQGQHPAPVAVCYYPTFSVCHCAPAQRLPVGMLRLITASSIPKQSSAPHLSCLTH